MQTRGWMVKLREEGEENRRTMKETLMIDDSKKATAGRQERPNKESRVE